MSIPAGASALLILTAVSASVVSASVSGSSNAKTIDSSSGVVTETLPAATGSGTVKLFANKAISSAATLAVASGDYLNNSLNGLSCSATTMRELNLKPSTMRQENGR